MSLTDELVPILKKLRLSGVLQTLDLRTQEAVDDELSFVEFLFRLLNDEVERREAKQLEQRLRRASFEHNKTLEDFDFHFNPSIPKAKVIDLATGTFVTRRENILLVGQAGVGKSHLARNRSRPSKGGSFRGRQSSRSTADHDRDLRLMWAGRPRSTSSAWNSRNGTC